MPTSQPMSLSFCLYNTAYQVSNYSLRQYKSKKTCVCVCVCVCVYTLAVCKKKKQSIEKLSFEIGLDTKLGFEHKVIW